MIHLPYCWCCTSGLLLFWFPCALYRVNNKHYLEASFSRIVLQHFNFEWRRIIIMLQHFKFEWGRIILCCNTLILNGEGLFRIIINMLHHFNTETFWTKLQQNFKTSSIFLWTPFYFPVLGKILLKSVLINESTILQPAFNTLDTMIMCSNNTQHKKTLIIA